MAVNAVSVALEMVNVWLSWIGGLVLFWVLMVKWFEVDFFGGVIIVVVSWVLRLWLAYLIFELTVGLMLRGG